MTIAAGFQCKDGVVLCADTEMSVGTTGKRISSKISHLTLLKDCFVAYAGYEDFFKEFIQCLKGSVHGMNAGQLITAIKEEYRRLYQQYFTMAPRSEKTWAYLLVSIRESKKPCLYVARGRHFVKVEGYEVIGIGSVMGTALLDPLCNTSMSVDDAVVAASYVLTVVKNCIQGCGGRSEIIAVRDSQDDLDYLWAVPRDHIKLFEEDFSFLKEHLRPVILAFSNLKIGKTEFSNLLRTLSGKLRERRDKNFRSKKRERKQWHRRLQSIDLSTYEELE